LERIAPDAGKISCIDMDFDKRRIVGFVASSENTYLYVVGLVAPEPLRIEAKQKITQQILDNLPNLD
jgi:beta-lactamase class D